MVPLGITSLSICLAGSLCDDVTSGTKKIEQGKEFCKRLKLILSKADFELRKWVTNDNKSQKKLFLRKTAAFVTVPLNFIVVWFIFELQ